MTSIDHTTKKWELSAILVFFFQVGHDWFEVFKLVLVDLPKRFDLIGWIGYQKNTGQRVFQARETRKKNGSRIFRREIESFQISVGRSTKGVSLLGWTGQQVFQAREKKKKTGPGF